MTDYLERLNEAQAQAVTHTPESSLQILAGPGSGKTRVLTTRIAHFVLHHQLDPRSICAVTFTNKAANEMRERLVKLIGKDRTDLLRMGTFHALCGRFLRKHAPLAGIKENFTICDSDESKKLIARLLKAHKDGLAAKELDLTEGRTLSYISKAKCRGVTPEEVRLHGVPSNSAQDKCLPPLVLQVVSDVYENYEASLRKSNSLDFDDLLIFGLKLFSRNPKAGEWCAHILVDEFQDTNTIQYQLMLHIAASSRCVTIVGDPDQSIYGWRSADVGNLKNMRDDFPGTVQIFLEENYRSTASIVAVSLAIVAEDQSRISKTLRTSHAEGHTPVLREFESEKHEASFLAIEIKRLVMLSGGMLDYGDFAILLRFNALSRVLEGVLQKEGIPNRVLAGHKFFERMEIKDLLAYLQLVDNPHYTPAFLRAVNVPPRSIGEKTTTELLTKAEMMNISPMEVAQRIYDGRIPDIKPPIKRKLKSFMEPVRTLRDLSRRGESAADLIRRLIDLIGYEEHLKKSQPDWETRWENVQELISFASPGMEREMEVVDVVAGIKTTPGRGGVHEVLEEEEDSPLRDFLQKSMLSSDDDSDEKDNKNKVTISTCHSAKGLEWPIVMVPAVESGTFPFHRTEDIEEERRLLYVACTRAQGLLYVTHVKRRLVGGNVIKKELSAFISAVTTKDKTLFGTRLTALAAADRKLLGDVLEKPLPMECLVTTGLSDFAKLNKYHPIDIMASQAIPAALRMNGGPRSLDAALVAPSNTSAGWIRPSVRSSNGNGSTLLNGSSVMYNRIQGTLSVGSAVASKPAQIVRRPTTSSAEQMRQARFSFLDSLPGVHCPPVTSSAVPFPNMPSSSSSRGQLASATTAYPAESISLPSVQSTSPSVQSSVQSSGLAALAPVAPPVERITSIASFQNTSSSFLSSLKALGPPEASRTAGLRSTLPPVQPVMAHPPQSETPATGSRAVKRRLGMGRSANGYPSKKFKPPTT